jgi:MFS family permease
MTIYLVVLISVLSQMGFGGSRVAVTLYALDLGANQFMVGVIVAFYSLCPMFFSIVIGRLSDRVPPYVPMIWGSVLMMAALLLPLAVPAIAALCVLAFVNGLGHLVFSIPLEAAVGGVGGVQHRTRNYALITMGWSVANFLGPLITGLLIDTIGHQRVFWVLAAFVVLPIPLLWWRPKLLPSTSKPAVGHNEGGKGKRVLDLWRMPALRSTFIAGGIIGSAQDLFQFYMPVYGHSVGLSASAIGTVLGMVAAAAFVIRAVIPFLTKRGHDTDVGYFYNGAGLLVAAVFCERVRVGGDRIFAWPGRGVRAADDHVVTLCAGAGRPHRRGDWTLQDLAQRYARRDPGIFWQCRNRIRLQDGVPVEFRAPRLWRLSPEQGAHSGECRPGELSALGSR